MKANLPGVGFTKLPEGFIKNNPEVYTPSVPIVYATRLSLMDDETARKIATGIGDQKQILIDVWPQLKDYDFKTSILSTEDIGIAVHPGAMTYWSAGN